MFNKDPIELLREWAAAKTGKQTSDLSNAEVALVIENNSQPLSRTMRNIERETIKVDKIGKVIEKNIQTLINK